MRFFYFYCVIFYCLSSPPLPEGGWDNDICIFGAVYGFIQNNYILYENTWENRHYTPTGFYKSYNILKTKQKE